MESLVAVAEYLYRSDAEIAAAHLLSAGIRSVVSAEDEGGLNPGFYSDFRVVLMVNGMDAAVARDVLGLDQPLVIPREPRLAMLTHSGWAYPNEACGLIAGVDSTVKMVFCLTNRLSSPSRYTIDPREHYGAARFAENCGYSILGAWHSHPNGDAMISETDIAESPGGSWLTIVVGNHPRQGAAIRAFRTEGARPVEREVVGDAAP